MGIFEIMVEVDEQYVQLERARTVLAEVIEDFDEVIEPDTTKAFLFIRNQARMRNLLHVADGLLFDMLPALRKATDELLEHHKAQKEVPAWATAADQHGGVFVMWAV